MENVKGFKDYTGEEALKREKVREIIIKNFRLYGFEPAETPVIEYEEFVKSGNEQDGAVSDIFKLQDKGGRKLALRYEFTFQLKRLSKNKKLPYRRYQIGEVFRDEPVSAARFRQFTQADVDVIGSSIKDEAEILAMTSKILNELGIKANINVNNRKLMNEILDKQEVKEKDRAQVIKEIDKLDKLPEQEVRKNLKKFGAEKVLQIFKKPTSFFEKYRGYSEIKELEKACKLYGIDVKFVPSLARGLSYYNRSVFEVKTREIKETIAAGGGYLVNGIQATGISFGIERISQIAKIKVGEERILIISIGEDEKAIKLAEKLRSNGISCFTMFGKISKALDWANSMKIPFVLFLGTEEVKKKKIKLRNMKSGREALISENEVIKKMSV